MAKFKIGDKVRVRKDAAKINEDSAVGWGDGMAAFIGKEVTIGDIVRYRGGEFYHIAEADANYSWDENSLELLVEEPSAPAGFRWEGEPFEHSGRTYRRIVVSDLPIVNDLVKCGGRLLGLTFDGPEPSSFTEERRLDGIKWMFGRSELFIACGGFVWENFAVRYESSKNREVLDKIAELEKNIEELKKSLED